MLSDLEPGWARDLCGSELMRIGSTCRRGSRGRVRDPDAAPLSFAVMQPSVTTRCAARRRQSLRTGQAWLGLPALVGAQRSAPLSAKISTTSLPSPHPSQCTLQAKQPMRSAESRSWRRNLRSRRPTAGAPSTSSRLLLRPSRCCCARFSGKPNRKIQRLPLLVATSVRKPPLLPCAGRAIRFLRRPPPRSASSSPVDMACTAAPRRGLRRRSRAGLR